MRNETARDALYESPIVSWRKRNGGCCISQASGRRHTARRTTLKMPYCAQSLSNSVNTLPRKKKTASGGTVALHAVKPTTSLWRARVRACNRSQSTSGAV